MRRVLLLAVILMTVASASHAVTYFVPEDREMIQRSDDIVIATGVTSLAERDSRGAIVTRYTLRIEEVLKGDRAPGDHLVLTEKGGRLDTAAYVVAGSPEYLSGQRYLVFTETNSRFEPITYGMGLGQFALRETRDRSFAVRSEIFGFDGNLDAHAERARDAKAFVEYIRGILALTADPVPHYFIDRLPDEARVQSEWKVQSQFTRTSYLMTFQGQGYRWDPPTATFITSGTSPAGVNGIAAVDDAIGEWNGTDSNINYKRGAQDDTLNDPILCQQCDDGKNSIYLTDLAGEVASNIAGTGGIVPSGGTHGVGDETFWTAVEGDLVMNDIAFTQSCYNTVMTHEMGHTLGFRHSNQPPAGGEDTTNAIMNSVVQCGWNGALKTYDNNAAATVYGTGVGCTPPSITTQPTNKTIIVGESTQLQVTATGTPTLSYQWYIGTAPDTSSPTGSNSNKLTVNPTSTTSYWVRVTGPCTEAPTSVDSTTVTVTVNPCPDVTVGVPSFTKNTNGTYALTVPSAGSGATYAWFKGDTPGVGGTQVGSARSITLNVTSISSFWVRVTNSCGNSGVSTLLTISPSCDLPSIVTQPASQVIASGGSATLTVVTSGVVTSVKWYQGAVGNKNVFVASGAAISVGPLTQSTQFWAAVANTCGEVASIAAVITVEAAPCPLPVITVQPQDQTVPPGVDVTLTFAVEGADSVTWYQGAVGDKSIVAGTGLTITIPRLLATTEYWAAATNACGEVATRLVRITADVNQCTGPSIVTQPLSQTIRPGETATLSVVAGGTEVLHYQWFAGDEPVGSDAPTFTTGALDETSQFSVQVTNGCGTIRSNSAVITVSKGRSRAVRH